MSMTFSIVARSPDGQTWGVAVASKFLAVGSVVPAAVAGIGAVATQADANVTYKSLALDHLDQGATAAITLARLLEDDEGREHRQVGLVDLDGGSASHAGHLCFDWAGGVNEENVAIQGNVLAGPEVIDAMKLSWDSSLDEPDLARRLLAALVAGDEDGGDRRGRQSAALLVVRDGAGYGAGDDIAVDLRVDDHQRPCQELERLLDLNHLYLTASTEEEKVQVTDQLRIELDDRARRLGHRDFLAWVGTGNYEMRVGAVDDQPGWVDVRILATLRSATPPGNS